MEIVRATPLGLGFRSLILRGKPIVSSSLFHAEIHNVFWKYARAGVIPLEAAGPYAREATRLVDEFVPIANNVAESFAEAARWDHPAYDLLYLTLARRNAATLLTADGKLAALCEHLGVGRVSEVELAERRLMEEG